MVIVHLIVTNSKHANKWFERRLDFVSLNYSLCDDNFSSKYNLYACKKYFSVLKMSHCTLRNETPIFLHKTVHS